MPKQEMVRDQETPIPAGLDDEYDGEYDGEYDSEIEDIEMLTKQ
jgi:hypothetical protein